MEFADNLNQEKQPYKYNGKELDKMHGVNLYDQEARQLATEIGRFTSIDPLAEKYYSISPYVYCGNNPIKFIDPDGREKIIGMGPNGQKEANKRKHIDNGMIHIYAHGNSNGFKFRNAKGDILREVTNASELKEFLTIYSDTWISKKDKEDIIIVFHSCETGWETVYDYETNEFFGSWAEGISKDMPGISFIAPSTTLGIDENEEAVIDTRSEMLGNWNMYKDGKKIKSWEGIPQNNPDMMDYNLPPDSERNTWDEVRTFILRALQAGAKLKIQ